MKKTTTTSLLVITVAAAFCGCSKGTTNTPINNNPNNSTPTIVENMTAIIDGTEFTRDTCRFYFQNANDTTNALIFDWPNLSWSGDYSPIIELSIEDYHGVGTYSLANGGKNFAELLNDRSTGGAGSYASGGSLTITAIYPNVVGTFHFATAMGIGVTNGSFIANRQ